METLCFFSSDAAPLYKKDVFRIMGLPFDSIIHFRYGSEHINFNIDESAIKNLLTNKCMIFFCRGNNLDTSIEQRNVTNTSLREATIEDIIFKKDTGLIHFYLKLGDFKTCTITNNNKSIEPPYKFVSKLEVSNNVISQWHERVKDIKADFTEQLFYQIEFYYKSRKRVIPKYSRSEQQSFIELEDESDFILDISFYDTSPSASHKSQKVEIASESTNILKVNAPQIIDIGARRDNRSYTIYTQSLSSINTFTFLHFKTILSSDSDPGDLVSSQNNDITIPIQIRKNKSRAFLFSLYSILAALSIAYGKLVANKLSLYGSFSLILMVHCIVCLFLACLAAFKLYQLFNKK